MSIINSLLDTDFYSFTQMQTVFHKYSDVMVRYSFKCRNKNNPLHLGKDATLDETWALVGLGHAIEREINNLCSLRFNDEELDYLRGLGLFKEDFISYLRTFKLSSDDIKVNVITRAEGSKNIPEELTISIEGSWLSTLLFEVPVLAIVSELYNTTLAKYSAFPDSRVATLLDREERVKKIGNDNINKKFELLTYNHRSYNDLHFADFGTRRRYSRDWQEYIIDKFRFSQSFIGTSNVMFAKKFNLKPIGTMSHQFLQAHQALVKVRDSQKEALEVWAHEYRGNLGIALSDVVGFDAFLRDFDLYFAKLYDGCRHDSGNPYSWCEKLIAHYESMGIDPKTKTAVFSDGLNFPLMAELNEAFKDKINVSFGIGTNLTNDVGIEPLQIVIKMVECNGQPVAKVSDSVGKGMCEDEDYLTHLKNVFKIED